MLSTITVLSKTWINKCISPAQWRHRNSECQERPTTTKLIPEISFNNYSSGMVHVMCPLLFLLLVNSKSKTEKNNTPAYLIFCHIWYPWKEIRFLSRDFTWDSWSLFIFTFLSTRIWCPKQFSGMAKGDAVSQTNSCLYFHMCQQYQFRMSVH